MIPVPWKRCIRKPQVPRLTLRLTILRLARQRRYEQTYQQPRSKSSSGGIASLWNTNKRRTIFNSTHSRVLPGSLMVEPHLDIYILKCHLQYRQRPPNHSPLSNTAMR